MKKTTDRINYFLNNMLLIEDLKALYSTESIDAAVVEFFKDLRKFLKTKLAKDLNINSCKNNLFFNLSEIEQNMSINKNLFIEELKSTLQYIEEEKIQKTKQEFAKELKKIIESFKLDYEINDINAIYKETSLENITIKEFKYFIREITTFKKFIYNYKNNKKVFERQIEDIKLLIISKDIQSISNLIDSKFTEINKSLNAERRKNKLTNMYKYLEEQNINITTYAILFDKNEDEMLEEFSNNIKEFTKNINIYKEHFRNLKIKKEISALKNNADLYDYFTQQAISSDLIKNCDNYTIRQIAYNVNVYFKEYSNNYSKDSLNTRKIIPNIGESIINLYNSHTTDYSFIGTLNFLIQSYSKLLEKAKNNSNLKNLISQYLLKILNIQSDLINKYKESISRNNKGVLTEQNKFDLESHFEKKHIMTFDTIDTIALDDAVSVELNNDNYKLTVYTPLVEPDLPLDLNNPEFLTLKKYYDNKRGVFTIKRTELNKKYSLKQNHLRYGFINEFTISEKGRIEEHTLTRTFFKVDANIRENNFGTILEGVTNKNRYYETYSNLFAISKLLSKTQNNKKNNMAIILYILNKNLTEYCLSHDIPLIDKDLEYITEENYNEYTPATFNAPIRRFNDYINIRALNDLGFNNEDKIKFEYVLDKVLKR